MLRRRRADSPHDPATADERHPLPNGVTRLAGYRLMRRLGSGDRATVYLGHAGDATTFAERTVALKVFEPHVTEASIDGEIACLSAPVSSHIVRLLDVGSSEGEPRCLVLQRLGGGSVASLLARGGRLSAGSAATVLVSAAYALADLHAAGFHHGALSPAALLLDDAGRPVLIGLGHAAPLAAGADAAWASRAHDYVHLGALCRAVFGAVDDGPARNAAGAIAEWLEALPAAAAPERIRVADELEQRLFGLARPRPVLTPPPADDARPSIDGDAGRRPPRQDRLRAAGEDGSARREQGAGTGTSAGTVVSEQGGGGIRDRFSSAVTIAERVLHGGGLRSLRAGLLTRLRVRRRPLIVGGVVAGVLLVVPLALLPVPSSRGEDSRAREAARASTAGADHTDSPAAASTRSPMPGTVTGDDPVGATEALLAARRACLRTGPLACLDGVDAPGSPLEDDDRSVIARRISATGTVAVGQDTVGEGAAGTGDYTVSLIQRTGGAALVALAPDPRADEPGIDTGDTRKPASALVIRGETGWRLREIFAN